jgi:hypothetical protein
MSTSRVPLRIRCRQIGVGDIDPLVNLLTRGFRVRTREFWLHAFRRLLEHSTPQGFPKYGYLLECNGAPVGVILLIFSFVAVNQEIRIRCSVSSWYVEPSFRGYAVLLASQALKYKDVTYFNITPHLDTLPILETQGYVRYCDGRFVAAPVISGWSNGRDVKLAVRGICANEWLPLAEAEVLANHTDYGCISVICAYDNRTYPFVFLPLWKSRAVRYAYLAYCRDVEEFVRFAGPLGRFLFRRGFPLVLIDSNGPIKGLIGKYSGEFPKYFRGPDRPALETSHTRNALCLAFSQRE